MSQDHHVPERGRSLGIQLRPGEASFDKSFEFAAGVHIHDPMRERTTEPLKQRLAPATARVGARGGSVVPIVPLVRPVTAAQVQGRVLVVLGRGGGRVRFTEIGQLCVSSRISNC